MIRAINGPEESWDPLNFISTNELDAIISNKCKKNDKEGLQIQVDCFSEANGSCYIEMGTTKIIAMLYGPREVPRKDDYDFKIANLKCEFRYTSFGCFLQRRTGGNQQSQRRDQNLDEKNISSVVEEALKPSILLYKYPKSQLDLYVLCLESDVEAKYILSASICAASMALANASIELFDIVASYTHLSNNLTVSFMSQLNQITSIYFTNQSLQADFFIAGELLKSNIKEAIENCKKLYTYMRYVLHEVKEKGIKY